MISPSILVKALRRCFFILTTVMLISGCFSSPKTGQPGGPAPAVVDIWHSLQGAEFNALEKQVKDIEKNHPEVIVKLSYVPEQNFAASAYQAEAGGEGPELFIASREIIHQLYGQGALAPAAYINEESFPAALAAFRFGNVEYALPWLTDISLLYFRTDTATVPADLSELFSAQGVSLVSADTASLSAWWNGQGGHLLNDGKPGLNDPSNLTFLQQLLAWRSTLRINPSAPAAFAEGQTPFLISGASTAKYLTQINVPWGSIPLSDLLGGQGQPLIGRTLGIANSAIKTTPEMTEAIQTVEKALLTPEVEGAMLEAGRLLPANKGYYERPEAQKGVLPQANISLTKACVLEGNAYEWKLIPLQDAAWSDVLSGNIAPEEALNNAQEQAGKVLSIKGPS